MRFAFPGIGTVVNVLAILIGGVAGLYFGKLLKPQQQDALAKASGICVIFLGISGAMEGMLTVQGQHLDAGSTMLVIASLILGGLAGEILDIEGKLEQFGEWLRNSTGNASDGGFIDGFVTASLTVSIGAMAILGAIQDGILGDPTTLYTKAVLDLIIIMVMAGAMGKGCIFSAVPVGILQGSVTLLARLISPLMTDAALANISLVGSIMVFCVGVNLVWGKTVRVANLLPSLIVAVAIAFLPM